MAEEGDGGSLPAGITRLRETTKWLIGGFAAVAAVLVAGAQLTSLGNLHPGEGRFWVAVIGLAVALAAVIAGILVAALTMTSSDVDLVELAGMPSNEPEEWRERDSWQVRQAADRVVAHYRPDLASPGPANPVPEGLTGVAALKATLEAQHGEYIEFRADLVALQERLSSATLEQLTGTGPDGWENTSSSGPCSSPAPGGQESGQPDAGEAAPGKRLSDAVMRVYRNREREIERTQSLTKTVLQTASFERMRLAFRRGLWILGGLALLASIGITMFVGAANRPEPETLLSPVVPPRPAVVTVPAAIQEEIRERLGAGCPLLGVPVHVLAASDDTLLVLPRDAACATEAFTVPGWAEVDEEEATEADDPPEDDDGGGDATGEGDGAGEG